MNERREKLFDVLEPPPGGLTGLRGRIERDRRRRVTSRRVQLLAAATLVAALAGWSLLAPGGGEEPLPPQFDFARMSLGQLPWPSETLTLAEDERGEIAVRRVSLPTDEVVFYLIASVEPDHLQ
jgi:hypothetical protein